MTCGRCAALFPLRPPQAGDGAAFGELALMYNCPRAASVRASRNCHMWALGRSAFRALLASAAASGAVQRVNFLRVRDRGLLSLLLAAFSTKTCPVTRLSRLLQNVPLLEPLGNQQVSHVAEALELERYKAGDTIIRQGDHGDRVRLPHAGSKRLALPSPARTCLSDSPSSSFSSQGKRSAHSAAPPARTSCCCGAAKEITSASSPS